MFMVALERALAIYFFDDTSFSLDRISVKHWSSSVFPGCHQQTLGLDKNNVSYKNNGLNTSYIKRPIMNP